MQGERLDNAGLLVDFGELKARTKEMLEEIDHKYLNELEAFQEQNPSSENLARYLFERLGPSLEPGSGSGSPGQCVGVGYLLRFVLPGLKSHWSEDASGRAWPGSSWGWWRCWGFRAKARTSPRKRAG